MLQRVCPFCGALSARSALTCSSCNRGLSRLRVAPASPKKTREPAHEPKTLIDPQMLLPLKWDEEEPVKTTEAEIIQDSRSGQFGPLPGSKLVCPFCGATKNGSTAICTCGGVLPIRLPDSGTPKPALKLSDKPITKTAPRISRPPERQIQEQKEPSEALRINRGRCLSCGSLLLSSFICVKCGAKLMPQTPQTETESLPKVSSPSFLSKLVGFFILGVVFGLLATQIADRLKCSGTLWKSPSSEKTPQVK